MTEHCLGVLSDAGRADRGAPRRGRALWPSAVTAPADLIPVATGRTFGIQGIPGAIFSESYAGGTDCAARLDEVVGGVAHRADNGADYP